MPEKTCCCHHWDRHECLRSRHPEQPYDPDEGGCECVCHDIYEEDELHDDDV